MAGSKQANPKWVIDTHGMVEALTTKQNSTRAAVIDAIECGEMLILRGVSDEISKLYPDLWASFKAIKKKKYLPTSIPMVHAATMLSERYGGSILGGIPSREHFEAVAAARFKKCRLVTAAKGLNDCRQIVAKCGLPTSSVVAITAVLPNAWSGASRAS